MDDARLKEPDADYFEEQLARIRDIRSSEKPFYDFRKLSDRYVLKGARHISAEATKVKAEGQFDAWHSRTLNEPRPFERHFAEATGNAKRIETARDTPARKGKRETS